MHEKIKCSGHLKNFLNLISTMVHFFLGLYFRARHHFTPRPSSSNSYRKDISTIPYNSYRRNIRGSIALALDPQLIFIQTLIPKLKWIPSSMGRKRMVACTSMEVFAWVTLGGLIANQYVLCSIFYWKNVITLKFQSLLYFSSFFLILIFLYSPTLMIPPK